MRNAIFEQAWSVVRAGLPACHFDRREGAGGSASPPLCAVILGSGFAGLVEGLPAAATLPYSAIPGLGQPGVEGHQGRLLLIEWEKAGVLVFQGRRHWHEGQGWAPVAIPVYLAHRLGCSSLILTNAAGAINRDFRPGDFMVIDDHVNLMGGNPLIGPRDPAWGPRFPDQRRVYCPRLRGLLDDAASNLGLSLRHGVYAAMPGPFYETPAEIRALRALGVDAVGMSTAPEASLACSLGLKTAAISCISNMAAGVDVAFSHDDVVAAVAAALPRLKALLARLIQRLPVPAPRAARSMPPTT
ncbi:MAG: purine-nucleoside phosphorylase [Verrucomicrobiota bacterium]|nr:purine-nucleoside phosphorylase [Verrucomicrobiota bacterium]